MYRGYTAPEYAIHGQLSEKVDTYSFGVVVLEIISGRRCNEIQVDPQSDYLLENVRPINFYHKYTFLILFILSMTLVLRYF